MFHNLEVMTVIWFFMSLKKCEVKIDGTPNRLEKYLVFMINKNLFFIDSIQIMNYSLKNRDKNLADSDFKYLTQEFGSKNLELLKQKDAYP